VDKRHGLGVPQAINMLAAVSHNLSQRLDRRRDWCKEDIDKTCGIGRGTRCGREGEKDGEMVHVLFYLDSGSTRILKPLDGHIQRTCSHL
jgi:hypothetical protein